jgi:hypothetical protein
VKALHGPLNPAKDEVPAAGIRPGYRYMKLLTNHPFGKKIAPWPNNRQENRPDPNQQQLINTYDPGGSIPFIDIGNRYTLSGASYDPQVLNNQNAQSIANAFQTHVAHRAEHPGHRQLPHRRHLRNHEPAAC